MQIGGRTQPETGHLGRVQSKQDPRSGHVRRWGRGREKKRQITKMVGLKGSLGKSNPTSGLEKFRVGSGIWQSYPVTGRELGDAQHLVVGPI